MAEAQKPHDGYDRFYTERLWQLVPAIYRSLDASGALQELLRRIGVQAATLRRTIDRLGENQSIETCDDWVIPYIGDLVATRLVACLPPAAQRTDVAKTIYYRRRAGTVGLLEELAYDIADHDARVVEFFRRLSRTRHQFDPAIGDTGAWTQGETTPLAVAEGLIGHYSRTPAGGFADLRNALGANNTGTAFDEYAYAADLRLGGTMRARPGAAVTAPPIQTNTGWYNISHLGVFVWWLRAFSIDGATPVSNGAIPPCYTFDPTGRNIPLFAPSQRAANPAGSFGENWVSPDEWTLPVAISASLWRAEPSHLYPVSPPSTNPGAFWVGYPSGSITPRLLPEQLSIHPDMGRFSFASGVPPANMQVGYYFGFASEIGAGGFSDSNLTTLPALPQVSISGGGSALSTALAGTVPAAPGATFEIVDSTTYTSLAAALNLPASMTVVMRAGDGQRPVLRASQAGAAWIMNGTVQPNTTGNPTQLILQGFHLQGADLVLTGNFDSVTLRLMTLDPGTSGSTSGLFQTAIDSLPLKPVTLYVEGSVTNLVLEHCITGPIRTRNGGAIQTLTATDSIIQSIPTHTVANASIQAGVQIFDPASLAAHLKNAPDLLSIQIASEPAVSAALQSYAVNRAPSAALLAAMTAALATVNQQQAEAAWPLALADLALGSSEGAVSLSRCTVMGPTYTHRLAASECILDGVATVEDPQHGCVRFSAYATGGNPHAPYRCVTVPRSAPLFQTRLYGQPEYARLRSDADNTIVTPASGGTILGGAQNGAEMGTYGGEVIALKKRGLAIKFEEFMPIGQAPVWIDVD